jgi:hypothetical protein
MVPGQQPGHDPNAPYVLKGVFNHLGRDVGIPGFPSAKGAGRTETVIAFRTARARSSEIEPFGLIRAMALVGVAEHWGGPGKLGVGGIYLAPLKLLRSRCFAL